MKEINKFDPDKIIHSLITRISRLKEILKEENLEMQRKIYNYSFTNQEEKFDLINDIEHLDKLIKARSDLKDKISLEKKRELQEMKNEMKIEFEDNQANLLRSIAINKVIIESISQVIMSKISHDSGYDNKGNLRLSNKLFKNMPPLNLNNKI